MYTEPCARESRPRFRPPGLRPDHPSTLGPVVGGSSCGAGRWAGGGSGGAGGLLKLCAAWVREGRLVPSAQITTRCCGQLFAKQLFNE